MKTDELPPCFTSRCEGCGWQGRFMGEFLYIVGGNYPISRAVPEMTNKCPKCKKQLRRCADRESLTVRFRWAAAHFGEDPERHSGGVMPCVCTHSPPCRLVGDVEIKSTMVGDTCFGGNDAWIRVSGPVKCDGCHAPATLAYVERHNWWDIDVRDVVTGEYKKAWEV